MRTSVPAAVLAAALLANPGPVHADPPPQQPGPAPPAAPPAAPQDAYADSTARNLHAAAAASWRTMHDSLASYAASVEQRMAAALRTPLRDRVIYRSESALRVLWRRGEEPITQVLGTRSRYLGGGDQGFAFAPRSLGWLREMPFDEPFDPAGDRLLFGLARKTPAPDDAQARSRTEIRNLGIVGPSDDFWFAHPLHPNATADYRFRSGDTLAISLPDGTRLTAVQLDVLPRQADPHLISGTLWIEPGSGALVRVVYGLARPLDMIRDMGELAPDEEPPPPIPPMLRPITMDVGFVAVSYALWENEFWLPRSMRMEAEVRLGRATVPVSFEMSYQIESVAAAADEAEQASRDFIAQALQGQDGAESEIVDTYVSGRPSRGIVIAPTDPDAVANSRHIPPPIWDEAAGFHDAADMEQFRAALAALPAAPPAAADRFTLDWPWTRDGLLRYNRVEGLAAGARAEAVLGRRFSLAATGRVGAADLRPRGRVELERTTVRRRLSWAAYRDLRATDAAGDYLGPGNSARALFLGRDYGDYYEAVGGAFAWRPPAVGRASFGFSVYAERQTAVETESGFAVLKAFSDDWTFRPNPVADEIEEAGAEARVSPRWGGGADDARFGLDLYVHGAEWRPWRAAAPGVAEGPAPAPVQPRRFVRAAATARAAFPLSRGSLFSWSYSWRLAAEASAGTAWGAAPVQRQWPLGGPSTLRGFRPGAASGTSFARGRVELAWVLLDVGASLFGDAGWAGDRAAFRLGDVLYGAGIGISVMDGLLRLDAARGLNGPAPGFRLHVHLDGIM